MKGNMITKLIERHIDYLISLFALGFAIYWGFWWGMIFTGLFNK